MTGEKATVGCAHEEHWASAEPAVANSVRATTDKGATARSREEQLSMD